MSGQALVNIQNNYISRPQLEELKTMDAYKEDVSSNVTQSTINAFQLSADIKQENKSLVLSTCVR